MTNPSPENHTREVVKKNPKDHGQSILFFQIYEPKDVSEDINMTEVRPKLQYTSAALSPHVTKYIKLLEKV